MNISTFNAFKSRNYRLFFIGQSTSLIGTWMQKTAVSWVIYAQTNSKFMLGLTLFASMFPSFVFSFLGGVVSDRYNRFKVLLMTQFASLLQAVLLTVLVFWGKDIVWGIIVLSAILGIINAFDVPARQSLVVDMVDDKNDLPNAIALNSTMFNLSRLIGPGIAGFVLEKLGDGVCFAINAFSFVAVIISLLMMKLPEYQPKVKTNNVAGDLKDGFRYVKETPSIAILLIQLGLISLLALPFATLIPVYAKDIFHGTASMFGVIDSVIGLGALVSAFYLASLKNGRNLHIILGINILIFGVGLILFSHTTLYAAALVFAAISGFGMMAQNTLSNTLIQTTVDPAMRGRVISFYAMIFFGTQPLGGLLIGLASQKIGTPNTVLIQGIITAAIGGLLLRYLHINKRKQRENLVSTTQEVAIEA